MAKQRLIPFILFMLTVGLTGCASMSADDCATANWRAIGYEDGSRGQTLERWYKREQACDKHGFSVDRGAYDMGRDEGLQVYCTVDNGFSAGQSGSQYTGVCQDHNEDEFLAAWEDGHGLYLFNTAVNHAEQSLHAAQERHDELDDLLAEYASGYRDEGLSTAEHNEKVLDLWGERNYLEDEAILYWNYAFRFLSEQREEFQYRLEQGEPQLSAFTPRNFPGPEPYEGPTGADAREMLREVFSEFSQ